MEAAQPAAVAADHAGLPPGEPDVVITTSPKPSGHVRGSMGQTVEQSDAARAAISKNREDLIARNAGAAQVEAAPEPEEAPPLRENIESMVIELPDGKEVVLAPPPGIPVSYRVAALLGPNSTNPLMSAIMRGLLFVRTYDGRPVPPINGELDATRFMNEIGEVATELISGTVGMYWPPVTIGDLKVLKKNLRGQ